MARIPDDQTRAILPNEEDIRPWENLIGTMYAGPACEKCGIVGDWGVKFVSSFYEDLSEHLLVTCKTCGFNFRMHCKDHKTEL